jgi:hypothetical protein
MTPADQAEVSGGSPTSPENSNVAEQASSGGLSSADVVANFLRRAQAKAGQSTETKAAQATSEKEETTTEATEEPAAEQANSEAETETTADSDEPTPEDSDTAPEDGDAEVLSQFPEKAQEKINKRIKALNDAKKAAEEKAANLEKKAAELEAKLNEAPPPEASAVNAPAPNSNSSLVESVHDEAGLRKLEGDAQTALTWIQTNSDKIIRAIAQESPTVELDGKEYTLDQVKTIQRVASETLTLGIPARRNFLQQRQSSVEQAKKKFPEFFNRSAPEYQQAQAILGQYPQLASLPNRELLLGYALRGLKADMAEQEAAAKAKQAKPAEAAKKPPMMGDSGAAASKPKTGSGANAVLKREVEEARKAFEESGSMESRIRLELARQKLKTAK